MDKIGAYTATADSNDEFTEGDPGQAIQATEVDEGWLNGVQRELLEVMTQMGLTPSNADDTLVWQALQKIYGKTHAGNPQGNVAADVLRERCWDTSVSPPELYIATAADGTTGGTTWTRLLNPDERPMFSKGDINLTVGTDTTTIQEALDQLPWIMRAEHEFIVNIPDGSYTEDLVLPTVIRERGNAAVGRTQSNIQILGNTSDATLVEIDSLWVAGGASDRVVLDGVTLVSDGPHADANSPLEVRPGIILTLQAVNFANNTGTPLTRAISVYGGGVVAKGPIDVGTDLYDRFVIVKNFGHYVDPGDPDDPTVGANDITGTVRAELFQNQNGYISRNRAMSLATSATAPPDALAYNTPRAPIYSFRQTSAGFGALYIEGVAKTDRRVFAAQPDADASLTNGNVIGIGVITLRVPPHSFVILRRLFFKINGAGAANLNAEVADTGGNAYTSTNTEGDDEGPDFVLFDNSANAAGSFRTISLRIANNSGSSQDYTGSSMVGVEIELHDFGD